MLKFLPFLVLVVPCVIGRIDPSHEPTEPSFSYCIGDGCDKDKDAQAVNDEGVAPDPGLGLCKGNETSFHEFPKDCHKYYICYNGTATEQTCPEEMGYRPDINLCVFERHVPACRCRKIRCEGNGLMPDYEDCNRYYNCFFGHPYHLSCAQGTRFDPVARQCTSTVPCLTGPSEHHHHGRTKKPKPKHESRVMLPRLNKIDTPFTI